MKKIILTLLAAVLIITNLSSVAYASEQGTTQPKQEVITYGSEQDETNISNEETPDTTDALQNGEELLILDGYEIFFDEQGQPYFLEKEPEEKVITEQADETEETEEESSEDTKSAEETKDKKPEVKKEGTKKEETKKEETKKEEPKAKKPSYSEKDLRLLASLVYSEAGNQSYKGMLAVANVVLNRVKSPSYSHCNTIKEVIYDKKWAVQFAVTVKSKKTGLSVLDKALASYDTGKFPGSNPAAEKKAMDKAIKAAKAALEGENNIGSYLCFNAINKSTSRIKKNYPDYKIIGDHIFYRTK